MRKVDPIRHEEKRREILAAAESCFSRKGFHGASIAEICSAARISPGHLYHYFASKEEIVEKLAERRLESALEAMEAILSGPVPLDKFLRLFCRPPPADEPGNGHLLMELLAEAGRNPAVAAMMRDQAGRARVLLGGLVRRGQADGDIDSGLDPELTASILIAIVVDGMKALVIRQPDVPREEVGDMIEMLVRRFLQPSSPRFV